MESSMNRVSGVVPASVSRSVDNDQFPKSKLSASMLSDPALMNIHTTKEAKLAELQGEYIPISDEQLIKAIERAIKTLEGNETMLDFSVHDQTKQMMVKVLNKDTGELIREIPPERSLDFLARVWEKIGILVDEKR